jgi:hypothetical protein
MFEGYRSAVSEFPVNYFYFFPKSLVKKFGSTGSFAWPWQRADLGTPRKTISTWFPQPLHDAFPHLRQILLLHIFFYQTQSLFIREIFQLAGATILLWNTIEGCINVIAAARPRGFSAAMTGNA